MAEEVDEIAERVDRLTEHEIAFRKRVRQQGGLEECDLSAAVALMRDLGGSQDFTMDEVTARIAQTLSAARMAWPEPQPITDAQKTGERFLVWPSDHLEPHWMIAWWDGLWTIRESEREFATVSENEVTHYLPLPPEVKP